MKLQEIVDLYKEIQTYKSFGGIYKTHVYSLEVINSVNSLPIKELITLTELRPNITIDQCQTRDWYEQIITVVGLLKQRLSHAENSELSPSLIEVNGEDLVLVKIDAVKLNELTVGHLLVLYDEDLEIIGKAIIKLLDKLNRIAKLKMFLTEDKQVRYARPDTWWELPRIELNWIKPNLLLNSSLTYAKLDVNYKVNTLALGRVQWQLFYTPHNKEEQLLAIGADITKPGYLTISKTKALFNMGQYRLRIVNRSINYSTPSIATLTWDIKEPVSVLNYEQ